jgi:tetratricopeptide (TPR) repeat protein
MSDPFPPVNPSSGMHPPNQDIYQKEPASNSARHRRRNRWFRLQAAHDPVSPAAAVSTGTGRRVEAIVQPNGRRRRKRRASEHSPHFDLVNRVTWISVTGVAVLYWLLLAGSVAWRRSHPPAPPPATPPESPAVDPMAKSVDTVPLAEHLEDWQYSLDKMSDLRLQKMNPEATIAALETILEKTPHFTQARLDLALALERQKRYAEARDQLVLVLDCDPASAPAREILGRICLALNQPGEALAMARWMIESDAFSAAGHEIAADALLKQDVPAEAVLHLKKLVTLNRDNITLHNNLGAAYIKLGDLRSALQTFREVLRLDDGNTVAHFNLAVVYAKQGDITNTVEVLNQASRRFGNSFVTTWTRGSEFDALRDDPGFARFLASETSATGTTNAP